MAEAIINNSDSEEDGELTNSTATSLKSGTMAVSETRGKMADGKQNSKKSSTRTSSRRSKRKDEMEELEQRVELRFTQMDERFERLFTLLSNSQSHNTNNNGSNDRTVGVNVHNKDTVTEGEQRPCSYQSQNSDSLGVHSNVDNSTNTNHFPNEECRVENEQTDVISLAPGHEERQDIGLLSDNESNSGSVRSDSEKQTCKKSARFSKYVKSISSDNTDKNENNKLQNLFGEDAKTKADSNSVGLILDNSQIDILSGSWRCKHPERMSAYNEEYKASFPVHDSTLEHLEVPTLDSVVSDLLVKRHGSKAFNNKKKCLFSPCMKSVEKLAYQGQISSRMGIITTAYTQQALGTLLETLSNDEVNIDRCVQLTRDIFAMTTKTLDQVARSGSFHHLVRRKVALEDTGLGGIKELKDSILSLPLSNSGVFGSNLEQTLKDRVDKNEQIQKLLPELNIPAPKPVSSKRKAGNSTFNANNYYKKQKVDNMNTINNSYSKPSIARNTPRANVTKDREPKVTTGTANFRSFGANKGQQKK